MFTGIIQQVGKIKQAENSGESTRLLVNTGFDDLELGESIAVCGVCLTVASIGPEPRDAAFFASRETISRTNLGKLRQGDRVNLERAATPSTRLSGHIVQGHVDGLATLDSATARAESHELVLVLPRALAKYCVEKGSIALNGVSLTINTISDCRIGITIIPHTWEHTDLSELNTGDTVNIEIDIIAKYVEKLCQR